MSLNLSGVLSLNANGFTSGINKAVSNVDKLDSKMKKAKGGMSGVTSGLKDVGGSAFGSIGNVKQLVGAFAGFKIVQKVIEGVTSSLKIGFSEAVDMEGYRTQLNTATKDTQKAGKLMSEAIKYANKTPFETGDVVQATATMEAYGLSSEKYLSDIGDMAGATNKGIMQSTEAMADAMVGEFERLKEFGIRKDQIVAKSNEKYGKNVVFNAKGQMLDEIKMMDTLQSIMQEKFKGGAEAQSKTIKGMMSTVTGTFKTGMASILGISTEGEKAGTILEGTLLDKIGGGINFISEKIQQLQDQGVFSAIGQSLSGFISGVTNGISTLQPYFNKFKDTFLPIIQDVFSTISSVIFPVFAESANNVFPKIGSLFMSLCTLVQTLWNGVLKPVFEAFAPVVNVVIESMANTFNGLVTVIQGVADLISGIISGDWTLAWNGAKEVVMGAIETITSALGGLINRAVETAGAVKEAFKNSFIGQGAQAVHNFFNKDEVPAKANGTSYAQGGLTQVNERGGELQMLRDGTTIVPAERSKQLIENNKNETTQKDVKIYIDAKGLSVNEMVSELKLRLGNI